MERANDTALPSSATPPAPAVPETTPEQMAIYTAIGMLARGFFMTYHVLAVRALFYALLRAVLDLRTDQGQVSTDGIHHFLRVVIATTLQRVPPAPSPYDDLVKEATRVTLHALQDPAAIFTCAEMLGVYLSGQHHEGVPSAPEIEQKQARIPPELQQEMGVFLGTLHAVREELSR